MSTGNLAFLGIDTEWKKVERSLLRGPHPKFIFQRVRPGSTEEKSQKKKKFNQIITVLKCLAETISKSYLLLLLLLSRFSCVQLCETP